MTEPRPDVPPAIRTENEPDPRAGTATPRAGAPSPAGHRHGPPAGHRLTSPAILLVLAAVFPGLPHLLRGRRGWAALLALPVLVPLLAVALLALVTGGTSLAARLVDPAVLTALLGVEVLLLAWRLFAVGAVLVLAPVRRTAPTLVAAAVAVAIVAAPQLVAAGLTADARDAAASVFAPVSEGGAWVPNATPPPVASNDPEFGTGAASSSAGAASGPPSAAPAPSPSEAVTRVNVLLIGVDAGVGRTTFLTDSLIVASLDPVAKTVSMASIARDTVDVPLPDGRVFRPKINSLVAYASMHADSFPGAKDGESVLAAAIGTLLGIKIDLWAEVNLGGFARLVDSVGGINIRVTSAFCDGRYKEYGVDGFQISPGWWHMNGDQALAYARVRKAAGESDFTRAARQQEIIGALRDRIVRGGLLNDPAQFLASLGQTVRTNIDPSFIADWIGAATQVGRADVFRIVVGHPYVAAGYDARGSIQIPDIPAIRAMAARLFPPAGIRPTGFDTMPSNGTGATKSASSSATCGAAPAPKPTPKATATPAATPTLTASDGATAPPSEAPTSEAPAASQGATPTPAPVGGSAAP